MIFGLVWFQLLDITMGLRMSEEDEFLGADFVEHGLSCRMEFPDGTVINATDANVLGDAHKMAAGMKVSKINNFLGIQLNTLPESQEDCEETSNGSHLVGHLTEDVTRDDITDVQANGNAIHHNGIHREAPIDCMGLSRNSSNASSTSRRKRTRENVEGQPNLGFKSDEDQTEHF